MDSEKFESVLRSAIERFPKPVRMRAQNAMDGFERAETLFDHDREMSSFRAITAQEEAASALFRALQIRNYPGSERLDLKRHEHKSALWPVIDAARMAVGEAFEDIEFKMSADPPKIYVALKLAKYVKDLPEQLKDTHIELVNPLDVLSSSGGEPNDFATQIQAIVEAHGEASIRDHIRRMANARNRILYASDQERPRSQATRESIAQRKSAAITALCLCVGILQTRRLQNYALQTLACFLRILDKADGVTMPYAETS